MLLTASYAFYAVSQPLHVLLLAWVTVVTAWAGSSIARHGRHALVLGLIGIFGTLFTYKYLGLVVSLVGLDRADTVGRLASTLALPVGISFYTMQAASYLIDVRRGTMPPARFLDTALYVSYFPQLLAGPIERAKDLMPQLRALQRPSATEVYLGCKLLLWGYFSKTVLGDGVARLIDTTWADWTELSWLSVIIVHVLFSLQIYFDFLGYTSIARGLGRLMGVSLSRNFFVPYGARSIRDFWRRWHMTLTSWFRDYVYIPLGGSRGGPVRWSVAVFVVFVLSGLWHGAAWTFLLWGIVHAAMYLVGQTTAPMRQRIRTALGIEGTAATTATQIVVTFLLVSMAWMPFRITEFSVLAASVARVATLAIPQEGSLLAASLVRLDSVVFVSLGVAFLFLDGAGVVRRYTDTVPTSRGSIAAELAMVNVLSVFLLFLGDLGTREFLYFRF